MSLLFQIGLNIMWGEELPNNDEDDLPFSVHSRRPRSTCWSCSESQSSGVPLWGRVSCSALSPLCFHLRRSGSSLLHLWHPVCSPASQRQPQPGWVCPHAHTGLGRDLHTEAVWYAKQQQQQMNEYQVSEAFCFVITRGFSCVVDFGFIIIVLIIIVNKRP